MSYITVADVKSVTKSRSPGSGTYATGADDSATDLIIQRAIDSTLAAFDDKLGQFLVGWEGARDCRVSEVQGRELALPRFRSITSIEYKKRGGDWTVLPADEYELVSAPHAWQGYWGAERNSGSFSSAYRWRVTAVWGWGWDTAEDELDYSADPVPAKYKEWAIMQANHVKSREGSASGQVFGAGGDVVTVGGGWWHQMVYRGLSGEIDKRRSTR